MIRLNRHNILFIYLIFLGLQFVAIDSFCPETPVGDSSIKIVGDGDDGKAGHAGNKGKAGSAGQRGHAGHMATVVQAAKHQTSVLKRDLAILEEAQLSVKGLAMMIFGVAALLTLPLVIFEVLSLNLADKQAQQQAAVVKARSIL